MWNSSLPFFSQYFFDAIIHCRYNSQNFIKIEEEKDGETGPEECMLLQDHCAKCVQKPDFKQFS